MIEIFSAFPISRCTKSVTRVLVTIQGYCTEGKMEIVPALLVSCHDRRSVDHLCRCQFEIWGALSDERMGLSFTIAAGRRERSHSRFVSDSRLPQPGGPGPHIYVVLSKSSRKMFIKTITSYLDLILHHYLQSSPLGSAHRFHCFCHF
jgi:hypothetical protein